MAIIIEKNSDLKPISLDEFITFVRTNIDFDSYDSLITAAPYLQSLALNESFFVDQINRQIRTSLGRETQGNNPYSANSLIVHSDDKFFIRINFWKPEGEVSEGTENFFAYECPHDHNFDFLTVGCFGPGYRTMIFEYDYDRVLGYTGEAVDIKFLGEETLSQGRVILFRRGKDIHTQIPPTALTISLNLMVKIPQSRSENQFEFDIDRGQILNYMNPSARETLINLSAQLGSDAAAEFLPDISEKHPCSRTRVAAIRALAQKQGLSVWNKFVDDAVPLVRELASRNAVTLEESLAP